MSLIVAALLALLYTPPGVGPLAFSLVALLWTSTGALFMYLDALGSKRRSPHWTWGQTLVSTALAVLIWPLALAEILFSRGIPGEAFVVDLGLVICVLGVFLLAQG